MEKKIRFESFMCLFELTNTQKQRDVLRGLYDIFKLAAKGKDVATTNELQKAKKLYEEFKKLNRQNDQLLELDNDFNQYDSQYTKDLHKRNEKQEEKVKKLAKEMNYKIVYYGPYATLYDIERDYDITLNFVI